MTASISEDARHITALADELARMRRDLDALTASVNATRMSATSVQDRGIAYYDGQGRKVSVVGRQPDGTTVGGVPVARQAPPEQPKPPTLIPGLGTIKVESHGSTSPPWPANYSHLNVWLSADSAQAQARIVGIIAGTGDGALIISGLAYQPYRIWFTSVNVSRSESERSAYATATPAQVVGQDILDGIITEVHLADEAVSAAKIAAEAIQNYHFGDKVVDLRALDDDSVGSDQIAADAILARHIGAAQVTAAAIVAEAIQAIHIAAEQIQADHLAADSVTARAIAALSILANHLAANSVTAGAIQVGAVLADAIRAGEVLANISLATGTQGGRRIVIDGPANEIRYYPAVSNLVYGRQFTYVPPDYPNAVTIETRAINASQSNVLPRQYLTPDKAVTAIVDPAAIDVNRGGLMMLTEDQGFFGLGANGGVAGLGVQQDGNLLMLGYFENYRFPGPGDAVFAFSITFNNTGASTVMVGAILYGATMASPMIPMLSVGIVGAAVKKQMYSVRDEGNNPVGFFLRFGLSSGTTAGDVGESPGIAPGTSVTVRGWVFRTNTEYTLNF